MCIEKTPTNKALFKNSILYYNCARDAFADVLKTSAKQGVKRILLPGYIGWSPREGSGVFDPVQASGMSYAFYKLNKELCIDIEYIKQLLSADSLILIIHYFGYPDVNYESIVALAKKLGTIVVEDCAHSFYSDYFGNVCGTRGDYSIYSLHKQFPFASGGMLKTKRPIDQFVGLHQTISNECNPWLYDIGMISETRRRNTFTLKRFLDSVKGVNVLRPDIPEGVVPQTLPVWIESDYRNSIYEMMNSSGFGVVSLYHTLIDEIDKKRIATNMNYPSIL